MIEPAPVPHRRARRGDGRATVADVARACGVSPMTVSRVVNGDGGVRGETRAAVSAAIARLDYRPNTAARQLAGRAQIRVALVHADGVEFGEMLAGGVAAADCADVLLTVERHEGDAAALAERLRQRGIDGVVLPPPLGDDAALCAALAAAGIATIPVAPAAPMGEAVTIDDHAAAAAMTAHLASLGHRRIGFVTGGPPTAARLEGYRSALTEAGLGFDPALVAAGDMTYRSGLAAAEALLALRHPPSAIFAAGDALAAAAISVAHRRRLRVPRDLSVAGFGDTALATAIWPALTTVRRPAAAMAEAAIVLLVDRVHRRGSAAGPRQFPFTLVHRDSVAPFA